MRRSNLAQIRAQVVERLSARRAEIEATALARVQAIPGGPTSGDPAYADGLRTAVVAAVEYGLQVVEHGEDRAPPIPSALLSQARVAARNDVSLDTVLRRYIAGYTLLENALIDELETRGMLQGDALKRLLLPQAVLFDRLLAVVSREHAQALAEDRRSSVMRRNDRILRLLGGQPVDVEEIGYDFDSWHLGLIVEGVGAEEAVQEVAASCGSRRLLVPRPEGALWAWMSTAIAPSLTSVCAHLGDGDHPVSIAVGEPARGVTGWRLTHRQAAAAWPLALRRNCRVIRYADVAVLVSSLQDDLLVTSLRDLYLVPLEGGRDGGALAKKTLREYFAAGRHTSSAAAALGVSRQTVAARLRAIERKLHRRLDECASELDIALRLDESQ